MRSLVTRREATGGPCRSTVPGPLDLLARSRSPVPWTPAVVCHGEDTEMIVGDQVDEVVGEPGDRCSTDLPICRDANNRGSRTGPLADKIDGRLDCGDEKFAETRIPILVPCRCVCELCDSFG